MPEKKKDRAPAEVKAARKKKERRRIYAGFGFFALWWVLFLLSFVPGLGWLMWVSWLALSGQMIAAYGLHERALRKIAGRPETDYRRLRRLQKEEIKTRPAAAGEVEK